MTITTRKIRILKRLSVASILTTLLFVDAQSQAVKNQPNRREGEIWFEAVKAEVGGQTLEGERGHLIVKENRKNPKSNLIELLFVRLKSTAEKPGYPTVYLDGGPGSSATSLASVPDYMWAFQKLREVGDVILLDQRGVGRSKPNLTHRSTESLPTDVFADREVALRAFKERAKTAADHFRSLGADILAYNSLESAHDVDDLRKALGAEMVNLVGFSYGTHLGLACIRYHGNNLNRVVLIGTEGPDHTDKLPSTSDASIRRLAEIVAKDPEIGNKMPDLTGTLKRVLDRLEKEPVTVTITDQRTKKPVDVKVGKVGLQFLIMRDLGDTNDLPIFPLWFYTMDKGDYAILKRFVERRYNQFGAGISVMTLVTDISSGASKARQQQIEKEAKAALLGDIVNFPISEMGDVFGNPDLGDAYRSPIKTDVPTLFVSGVLDNNTQPLQADEVRKTFKNSTHIIIENAGHESMLVDPQVQQTMVDFLRGKDVSTVKIALPALKFQWLP
ncbi:MAG TPA: alpha/beta fold hydrolase [Pyrinomonadaceae bacterium]|nr:alpha/beta fold hydrolase [Pyrinomonadaceae bacterium]